jgi:protein-glutamine gamma-glutamyltransferase
MKAPPFWIAAALCFWGMQTGLWAYAIPLAIVLEAARWVPWKLNLSMQQVNRIWDVCALSWTGTAIYLYYEYDPTYAVISAVKWLPIFAFPLLAAQAYSAAPAINRGTFFWLMRRHVRRDGSEPNLDVSFGYGGVCALAAAAANVRDSSFYIGVAVLTGYAVFANRSRRTFAPVTVALFAVVALLGYVAAEQMRVLQSRLESQTARWIYGWIPQDKESEEGYSRIGSFGEVKNSSRIVLKIQGEIPARAPDLLRQLSFNRYEPGIWIAARRDYHPVTEDGMHSYAFLPQKNARRSAVISMPLLPRKRTLLPLPTGTARISDLPVGQLELNRLGAVRVANGPETVQYRFNFGPGQTVDAPPSSFDLEIPTQDKALLYNIIGELGLTNQSPERAMATLTGWFQKKFRYSIEAPPDQPFSRRTARQVLTRFLTETRVGHCEHFATATALLLRAAGIPARYAVGYSVQDSARSGDSYIVRQRHAHAWTLAFINGHWVDFDTTPPMWDDQERADYSIFHIIGEWFSEMRFRYTLWSFEDHTGLPGKYLFIPLALLVGFIVWRIFARKRHMFLVRKGSKQPKAIGYPGLDSEFYKIEARLRRMGLERHKGETIAAWLKRVERPELKPAIDLHYRYRFDPQSLTTEERAALKHEADLWLQAPRG